MITNGSWCNIRNHWAIHWMVAVWAFCLLVWHIVAPPPTKAGGAYSCFLPLPNDGKWRTYYSESEVGDKEVQRDLDEFFHKVIKHNNYYPQPEWITALISKHGAKLIPYAVKAASDRGVCIGDGPSLGAARYNEPLVCEILAAYETPNAAPLLKKVMLDSRLGWCVRRAITKMPLTYTKTELAELLNKYDGRQVPFPQTLLNQLESLSGEERADILLDLIARMGDVTSRSDLQEGIHLAGHNGRDILTISDLVKRLGDTASCNALKVLKQTSGNFMRFKPVIPLKPEQLQKKGLYGLTAEEVAYTLLPVYEDTTNKIQSKCTCRGR